MRRCRRYGYAAGPGFGAGFADVFVNAVIGCEHLDLYQRYARDRYPGNLPVYDRG
jgi:hypothetical protein